MLKSFLTEVGLVLKPHASNVPHPLRGKCSAVQFHKYFIRVQELYVSVKNFTLGFGQLNNGNWNPRFIAGASIQLLISHMKLVLMEQSLYGGLNPILHLPPHLDCPHVVALGTGCLPTCLS